MSVSVHAKAPINIYHIPPSTPSRAVRLTASILDLDVKLIPVDLLNGEHLQPEFLKLNPTHTVPVIDDDGFVIWESRAIMTYLVDEYAPEGDDSLYPRNPKKRALVNNRLFFDMGTLHQRFVDYYINYIFFGLPLDPEKLKKFEEALGYFNTILGNTSFAAGNQLTIADISFVTTICNIDVFEFDLNPYPNVKAWYARTKEALEPYGYEEINQKGAEALRVYWKSKNECENDPNILIVDKKDSVPDFN